MRFGKVVLILVVMAVIGTIALQRALPAYAQIRANLRIISPQNGAQVATDFVEVQYELLNPGAAGADSPTFQLQLDGRDPVQTDSTNYTFTGLAPGPHTVVIQVVDANGNPITNNTNAVQFTVLPPPPPGSTGPSGEAVTLPASGHGVLEPAGLHQSARAQNGGAAAEESLPNAGSALPLLSIIGFGVLLGGIASVLKTR